METERYFFALSFISDIKWTQITSAETYKNSGGLIVEERELRFEMGCFAEKTEEN